MKQHSVIIGTGGRLGSALLTACDPHHRVTALSRKELDLTSLSAIRTVLGELEYDTLWLSAAITDVDFCETHPEVAAAVNTAAIKEIARISAEKAAKVVFFSTDYVFDGQKGELYEEEDEALPVNVYGRTKLSAERHVLAADDKNLVVRLSKLFGPQKLSFPDWVVRQAIEKDSFSLVEDHFSSPTYTEDVVAALLPLIKGETSWSGILHLCNSGVCSWLEWGQYCLDRLALEGLSFRVKEIDACLMSDIKSFIAQRPAYSAMSNARYHKLSDQVMPSWQNAVDRYVVDYLAPRLKK
ncbi:MAG: dTDP-4-dehydrorhamnose reductase [Verrucomicrobiales bacterium]|nr:dTDP-4-dehydrorhamnose reductase [Verrucomicrobiales bacterium]